MRRIILGITAVGYFICFALFVQIPDDKFHVYFLNVGQGDSILIKTPQNHQILVDGGPGNAVIEELAAVMPFFDKSIDMVVLSHPHEDHIAGLVEVLERYEVNTVLFTGVKYNNSSYDEFLRLIETKNIGMMFAEADRDFSFGEVFFDVIYPFDPIVGQTFSNVNNSSVGMKVLYKDVSVLLTGDLEMEGERALLESGVDLKANVFKAGHHGSGTSSTFAFLQKVQPEVVAIQCGLDNQFNHPNPETIRNLYKIGVKQIYRNDIDGRVDLIF